MAQSESESSPSIMKTRRPHKMSKNVFEVLAVRDLLLHSQATGKSEKIEIPLSLSLSKTKKSPAPPQLLKLKFRVASWFSR